MKNEITNAKFACTRIDVDINKTVRHADTRIALLAKVYSSSELQDDSVHSEFLVDTDVLVNDSTEEKQGFARLPEKQVTLAKVSSASIRVHKKRTNRPSQHRTFAYVLFLLFFRELVSFPGLKQL